MSDGMLALLIFAPIGCLALIGLAALAESHTANQPNRRTHEARRG